MESISTILKYTNWTKDELLSMKEDAPHLFNLWEHFATLAKKLEIQQQQLKIKTLLHESS